MVTTATKKPAPKRTAHERRLATALEQALKTIEDLQRPNATAPTPTEPEPFYILWNALSPLPPRQKFSTLETAMEVAAKMASKMEFDNSRSGGSNAFHVMKSVALVQPVRMPLSTTMYRG